MTFDFSHGHDLPYKESVPCSRYSAPHVRERRQEYDSVLRESRGVRGRTKNILDDSEYNTRSYDTISTLEEAQSTNAATMILSEESRDLDEQLEHPRRSLTDIFERAACAAAPLSNQPKPVTCRSLRKSARRGLLCGATILLESTSFQPTVLRDPGSVVAAKQCNVCDNGDVGSRTGDGERGLPASDVSSKGMEHVLTEVYGQPRQR